MKISIVIPAYNEADRIVGTIQEMKDYLRQQNTWDDYEIIVVSDGSSDDTSSIVKSLRHDFKSLKLIAYPENKGKGYAVKTGILATTSDLVLFADADGATPIKELDRLATPILSGRADIVIASRRTPDANIAKKQPPHRVFIGKVFSFINTAILRMPFLDTQCGFKLFKGELARRLFGLQISDGFVFDVEILFHAVRAGYRVKELGVTWNDRIGSKVSPIKDGIRMLARVSQLAWRERFSSDAPRVLPSPENLSEQEG